MILLGFLLTYLGYKAGRASNMDQHPAANVQEFSPQSQEMTLPVEGQTSEVSESIKTEAAAPAADTGKEGQNRSAIEEELRLHKLANSPEPQETKREVEKKPIAAKPVTIKEYFAIQVGAFSSFQNAKSYAAHFNEMGYKTEIVSAEGAGGTLYRLWVGQYDNRNRALQENSRLEKKENKKFALVSTR